MLPTTWPGRVVAAVYVLLVAVLAAIGTAQPQVNPDERCFFAALWLTLPALVPLLPVLYFGGAWAQNASGVGTASESIGGATVDANGVVTTWGDAADPGGAIWVVVLVYTTILTVIAIANVALLHSLFVLWRNGQRDRAARAAAVRTG